MKSVRDHHIATIEEMQRLLRIALGTLEPTLGRAEVDNRAIGAVRMLATKTLESLDDLHADLAPSGDAAHPALASSAPPAP